MGGLLSRFRKKKSGKLQEEENEMERKSLKEIEYLASDKIFISEDIYQMTIAINMTRNVSPAQNGFANKHCIVVFLI